MTMIPVQLETDTINQILDELGGLLYDHLCQAHEREINSAIPNESGSLPKKKGSIHL